MLVLPRWMQVIGASSGLPTYPCPRRGKLTGVRSRRLPFPGRQIRRRHAPLFRSPCPSVSWPPKQSAPQRRRTARGACRWTVRGYGVRWQDQPRTPGTPWAHGLPLDRSGPLALRRFAHIHKHRVRFTGELDSLLQGERLHVFQRGSRSVLAAYMRQERHPTMMSSG